MKKNEKRVLSLAITVSILAIMGTNVGAMHISEGFLPAKWCIFWGALYLPFLVFGVITLKKKLGSNGRLKILFAMSTAFCFVLSALKMPSLSGSSTHPTGTGMGTILFGPLEMGVIGFIVLLFQSLLLAHGGITTLGANAFSMAVAGPMVAYLLYVALKKAKVNQTVTIFLVAMVADFATYVITSLQLALAFPGEVGFMASLTKFLAVFAVTQVPIAIAEGLLAVIVFKSISSLCADELVELGVGGGK